MHHGGSAYRVQIAGLRGVDAGFALRGSASLEADLPVAASLGGVSLSGVHIGLRAANDRVETEISSTLSVALGPIHARIDRVGVQGTLRFPANGGNFGPADLSLGFKPPAGVALSIDAKGILSGGGFLYHDEARSLYAGAMQLSLQNLLTLKGFGLIATRMPDGSPGYSLIVFITAEDFRPIPLGFGFNLLGIGGMVAINRTFDLEVLRAGLRNDTLGTLLFRPGLIPSYLAAVRELFPATEAGWRIPILQLFTLAGMAAGTWLAGWIFDLTANYHVAFAAGVAGNLANLAVVGALVLRQRGRAAA